MNMLQVLKTLILVVSFVFMASLFPSGGFLTKDGSLLNFWSIPLACLLTVGFLQHVKETGGQAPKWIYPLLSSLAQGIGAGLSLGAVLILNEWYGNPDNGQWEPLFTSIGFSSAVALFAGK